MNSNVQVCTNTPSDEENKNGSNVPSSQERWNKKKRGRQTGGQTFRDLIYVYMPDAYTGNTNVLDSSSTTTTATTLGITISILFSYKLILQKLQYFKHFPFAIWHKKKLYLLWYITNQLTINNSNSSFMPNLSITDLTRTVYR